MILDIDMWAAWTIIAFIIVIMLLITWLIRRLFKMASVGFTVNITINPSASPLTVVSDPLNITGEVGKPLSIDLAGNVQGGVAPVNFAITAGTLPNGLSLSGSVLQGTPTQAGTVTIGVSATDAA